MPEMPAPTTRTSRCSAVVTRVSPAIGPESYTSEASRTGSLTRPRSMDSHHLGADPVRGSGTSVPEPAGHGILLSLAGQVRLQQRVHPGQCSLAQPGVVGDHAVAQLEAVQAACRGVDPRLRHTRHRDDHLLLVLGVLEVGDVFQEFTEAI